MHFLTQSPINSLTTTFNIAVFLMICQLFIQTSNAIYTFTPSDSCQPACRGSRTCLKQTRDCNESRCPSITYCVNIRHLPHRYRDTIRELLATPSPRPGCPNRLLYSPCISQCQEDSGCRSGHLCCFNGCGRVCVPDLRQPYRRKPGFCPKRSWNLNPTCESNCQNDYECPGDQKCCRTPCGMKCTGPCFLLADRWRLPPGCRGPAR